MENKKDMASKQEFNPHAVPAMVCESGRRKIIDGNCMTKSEREHLLLQSVNEQFNSFFGASSNE